MDGGFTHKFTVLVIIGYMFQDSISSGNIRIDMPPVVTVCEGEDVELMCKARYKNGTMVSLCGLNGVVLLWKMGKKIENKTENDIPDEIARSDDLAAFKNKTVKLNKDNGNLTILNIGLSDDAVFHCVLFGPNISGGSNKTEVRVKKANFGVQTGRNHSPREGENVTLPCSVIDSCTTGKRDFTYKWSLNNTMLQSCNTIGEVDQTGKFVLNHGKTSCNLTILNVNLNDIGRYQCHVHDSFYNQSNYNYTTIGPASQPVSTAATNYMTDVGPTYLKTLTLRSSQGPGATKFAPIARSGSVLVIAVSSSGLLVIVTSLIVVALRLHTKRYSATPKSQTNAASFASVTFRRGPSQGNAQMVALNLSGRVEDQAADADTGIRVNGHQFASSPSSLIDNHNVVQHYHCGDGVMYTSVNRQKSPQASAVVYAGVTGAAAIKYQPKKVTRPGELVYADLQHTRQHPPNAPPIRTEPPTQYAEVRHNMSRTHRSSTSAPSGHIFDNDEEVELWIVDSENEAPPPPPRGIFNPPLYY